MLELLFAGGNDVYWQYDSCARMLASCACQRVDMAGFSILLLIDYEVGKGRRVEPISNAFGEGGK